MPHQGASVRHALLSCALICFMAGSKAISSVSAGMNAQEVLPVGTFRPSCGRLDMFVQMPPPHPLLTMRP